MPGMSIRLGDRLCLLALIGVLLAVPMAGAFVAAWNGVLRDAAGKPINAAKVRLHAKANGRDYEATTSTSGTFAFTGIVAAEYELSAEAGGKSWRAAVPIIIKDGTALTTILQASADSSELRLLPASEAISVQSSGGEHLRSKASVYSKGVLRKLEKSRPTSSELLRSSQNCVLRIQHNLVHSDRRNQPKHGLRAVGQHFA